ncbi:MAG: hypothetical protein IPN36_06945 [Bacteroidetes bacterium]|nr:hypothetical protein [Bacteroidota bacterium]
MKNNLNTGISSIHRAGEIIFFAGALLIAFSLPLWNLGMSLGQFVMAGGWLMAGNLKGRLHNAIRQPVFLVTHGIISGASTGYGIRKISSMLLKTFVLSFLFVNAITFRGRTITNG